MRSLPCLGAAALCLALAAGCASAPPPPRPAPSSLACTAPPSPELLATVLQPFQLVFEPDDVHAMLYFEQHPTYESVEAMIRERPGLEPRIRVIFTRHDQTQVDYFNDEAVAALKRSRNPERDTYYTPMDYTHTLEHGRPRVVLGLTSEQGERVVFDLHAVSQPLERHAGLTSPGRHAEQSALPIMYRYRSTMASAASRISFNGVPYPIPVQVRVPLFFTGLKGYYSEGFRLGVLKAGRPRLQLVHHPAALLPGERWAYRMDGREWAYTIQHVGSEELTLEGAGERLLLARSGGCLGLKQILLGAGATGAGQGGTFRLDFEPLLPLPSVVAEGQSIQVGFTISMDELPPLLRGRVTLSRGKGEVHMRLEPDAPEWATRRVVSTRITEPRSGQFDLEALILNGG